MSARHAILKRLARSPNLAVEGIVELALLARPNPQAQDELWNVIAERNKRGGWISLIRAYDRLADPIRDRLLQRGRELYGPLSEAMGDVEGPTRGNVIEIVRRCDDARLASLLAQALIDNRPEIRILAGTCLLASIQKYRARGGADSEEDDAFILDDGAALRRAIDHAVRQYKTHKQPTALLAALIFERQQDAPLWAYFHDQHEELTKAAAALLRVPSPTAGPFLASVLFVALASPLKPAAMAGIAATEDLDSCRALLRESFRLLDPRLRDTARGMGHLKALAVLWKDAPPDADTWPQWLRLIDAVGLQPREKTLWLSRLLEKAPATESPGAPWKLALMVSIAGIGSLDAGRLFARLLADADERVARCAARYLLSKKHPEWRGFAASSPSPHAAVRRMLGQTHTQVSRSGNSLVNDRVNAVVGPAAGKPPPEFNRVWDEYAEMPPAVQNSVARTAAAGDPEFSQRLKTKLASSLTLDIAQGLKMIATLPSLAPYREPIIALCGHADARIAAAAVKLVGRLEDPRLKDLLEAAARHADPRVRANAVDSMAALHIAHRSQQVLSLLNSRHNRERANAIRALSEFNFATARECLQKMLADPNPLHRISALWVLEQLTLPGLFRQVSSVARRDSNLRVRKRAADMLETLTGSAPAQPAGRTS